MTSAELRDVRSAKAFCLITAVRVESEAVETLWLIFFTFIKQEVLKITFITFLVRLWCRPNFWNTDKDLSSRTECFSPLLYIGDEQWCVVRCMTGEVWKTSQIEADVLTQSTYINTYIEIRNGVMLYLHVYLKSMALCLKWVKLWKLIFSYHSFPASSTSHDDLARHRILIYTAIRRHEKMWIRNYRNSKISYFATV